MVAKGKRIADKTLKQLLEAIHDIVERRCLHNDVKPGNIALVFNGQDVVAKVRTMMVLSPAKTG